MSRKELTVHFNQTFNTNLKVTAITAACKRNKIKSGRDGRFTKGCFAFNKGMSWNDYMSEEGQKKSRQTSFKKGNIPHQYEEVGTEVVDSDGYHKVKVADPNVWVFKHRMIWEQTHGPIEDNHVIIFLDGNKSNCVINNLASISRSELLIMNRCNLIKKDAELTRTGILIAKTMDKANKRQKGDENEK